MAHDNYDKFYTWDKGTLILDPGVFAWDEPHVPVCNQALPFANVFDKIADEKFANACDKPARLLSTLHSPAPAEVLARCETVEPGRAYCCPPYVMPKNWRMDYLTMDYCPTSLGQEEEIMNGNGNGICTDAEIYYAEAMLIGQEVQSQPDMVIEELTDDARAVYKTIDEELQQIAPVVDDVVAPVVEPTRQTVRKWPLVSLGLGVAAGLIVGKMLTR